MMIIGICDDETKECERIREFVKAMPEMSKEEIAVYTYEPDEFRSLLEDREHASGMTKDDYSADDNTNNNVDSADVEGRSTASWDIMIMDIEFRDRDYDGIVLTRKLNNVCAGCQVIYLTHILEFAPEVYDTDHCYFVMKNNMELMLPRALDKAVNIYHSRMSQRPLEIMSDGHKVYIPQEDIRYVEKNQRQTIVHTDKSAYTCYESISALSKKLSENVVRCHGGYLVNLSHVIYLGGEKIVMDIPDVEVPVGKTYKEQAKQAYLKYWMNRM